jgi:hypothetical protein
MAQGDIAALARAWELVAYFFGEGVTAPADVDPGLVEKIASLHRLEATLADPRLAIRSPETFVAPGVYQRWQRARAGVIAQSVQRDQPFRKVFAALAPLEAIVFKGAASAELLYPSPGDRPMVDLDLLVRPEGAPEAARRLLAIGYRCYFSGRPFFRGRTYLPYYFSGPPFFHRRHYHEWPFAGPDLEIDLHRGFTQASRIAADYAGLFERSIPWAALAPNARLLSPEDAVVVAAIQPGLNNLALSSFPAIGLLDLKLMLEREGPFWGSAGGPPLRLGDVARRATDWRAGAFVYTGLSYAARLFPSLAGRASAAQPLLASWRRREIDRRMLDRAFPPRLDDPTPPEVRIRKLLLTSPGALLRLEVERTAGRATWLVRRLLGRAKRDPAPQGGPLAGHSSAK